MTAISVRGLDVSAGGTPLLENVDFDLPSGTLTGLVGPNGAGKTTLLRTILGLAPCTGGVISLDEHRLDQWPAAQRAGMISYLPQSGVVHWPMTVERLVALGRLPHCDPWRAMKETDARAITEALRNADVAHLRKRRVTTLSGGERARVLLARMLATEAPVLLADEPVAALDPAHQFQVMALLQSRARQGAAVLIVLHDLALAARFCDRLVLLNRGRVVADGNARTVLSAENLAAVYGVQALKPLHEPVLAPLEPSA